MNARMRRLEAMSRRDVLLGLAAAAGGSGLFGPDRAFAQAAGSWTAAPSSKVDKLNFVVWTYGDIYARSPRSSSRTGASRSIPRSPRSTTTRPSW